MANNFYSGNAIIMTSTTLAILALTWGGAAYAWSSYQVLIPLLLGFVGIGLFVWYEAKVAQEPVIPIRLVKSRTSMSGRVVHLLPRKTHLLK